MAILQILWGCYIYIGFCLLVFPVSIDESIMINNQMASNVHGEVDEVREERLRRRREHDRLRRERETSEERHARFVNL